MLDQRVGAAVGGGVVECVEQLAEGDGGRAVLAGGLVEAAVGDHESFAGGHDRVEQELAVLAAQVALAGERGAGEDVVAVDGRGAREHAVVETEQAHDAVRHRAHRHHGADGERAGAEVGPGRLARQPFGHQCADVGEPQLEGAAGAPRVAGECRELALHLAGLPLVAAGDGGEGVEALAEGVEPVVDGVAAAQPVGDCLQPVEELGEPAGQLDAGRPDVVERQGGADPARAVGLRVVGHRHPGEDPVEAEAPGVLDVAVEPVRRPVLLVVGPTDAGLLDPAGDRLEVVVGQTEAAAHRVGGDQVEHGTRLGTATSEVEQRAQHREQRVGLGQRPVGEAHLEELAGVAARDGRTHAERRLDQRGVGLDVGAHHQDVARLERGVVGQQPEQHLAQHLDLAGRAVARVHLHAAVVDVEDPAGRVDGGVGRDVGLEPGQQRPSVIEPVEILVDRLGLDRLGLDRLDHR